MNIQIAEQSGAPTMVKQNKRDLSELEARIGYTFKDRELIELATTHKSYMGDRNFERLELMGDTVLSTVILKHLYYRFPKFNEGQLSRLRMGLVNWDTLAHAGRKHGLQRHIRIAPNSPITARTLSDVVEAIFGAVYLDAGLDAATSVILHVLEDRLANVSLDPRAASRRNPKLALQRNLDQRKLGKPVYTVLSEEQAHDKSGAIFKVRVDVTGHASATGVGRNRRDAEANAARAFMNAHGWRHDKPEVWDKSGHER